MAIFSRVQVLLSINLVQQLISLISKGIYMLTPVKAIHLIYLLRDHIFFL